MISRSQFDRANPAIAPAHCTLQQILLRIADGLAASRRHRPAPVTPVQLTAVHVGIVWHALHTPKYDFNDEILPLGAAYWVSIVREELRAG